MTQTTTDACAICHAKFTKSATNLAIYDCGHTFHLSCVLKNAKLYNASCIICNGVQNLNLKPNLGDDRNIAIKSNIQARIKRRQMTPAVEPNWFMKLMSAISPFNSPPQTITDYIAAGYKLSDLTRDGFTPADCVQAKMQWSTLRKQYSMAHLLQFGFKWKEMTEMGIKSRNLNDFTWSQLKHGLGITANDLLKLNMNLQELADLEYSPHQLNDLGFNWDTFVAMGATVETLAAFKLTTQDIKTYFNPTVHQWQAAGFYDKNRLTKSGWSVDEVIRVLPQSSCRGGDGRQLRLTF